MFYSWIMHSAEQMAYNLIKSNTTVEASSINFVRQPLQLLSIIAIQLANTSSKSASLSSKVTQYGIDPHIIQRWQCIAVMNDEGLFFKFMKNKGLFGKFTKFKSKEIPFEAYRKH